MFLVARAFVALRHPNFIIIVRYSERYALDYPLSHETLVQITENFRAVRG